MTICLPLSVCDPKLIDLLPIEVKRNETAYTFDWFDHGDMYSQQFLDAVIDGLNYIKKLRNTDLTPFEQVAFCHLQKEIEDCFDENNVSYPEYTDPRDAVLDYFAWLFRIIAPRPRRVTYSATLQNKMNSLGKYVVLLLEQYKTLFEVGENANDYLSNNTKDSEGYDYLRYIWHVFHLHLLDSSKTGKKRSGTQLLVAVTLDDVLFVDVISHPGRGKSYEYFNLDHLRAIRDSGWFPKIGFMEKTDDELCSLTYKLEKDEDIYTLCKANINSYIELDSKIYICPTGVSSSSHPMEAVYTLNGIKKNIQRYEQQGAQCESVKFASGVNGLLMVVMTVNMPDGNREICDLLTGMKIYAQ